MKPTRTPGPEPALRLRADAADGATGQNRLVPARAGMHVIDTGRELATIGVSIPVPDPYGAELEGWRRLFGDPLARFVPAHITLLPPTRLPAPSLPEAEERLGEVARSHSVFDILLRGTATFRPVSPVVFVSVVRGIGDCERLQQAVRTGPLERPLSFPYHPHVTVAQCLEESILDQAFEKLADYTAAFCADAFVLYERDGEGSWRVRTRFPLAAGKP